MVNFEGWFLGTRDDSTYTNIQVFERTGCYEVGSDQLLNDEM